MKSIGNPSMMKESAETIQKVASAPILITPATAGRRSILAKEGISLFLLHLCRRVELQRLNQVELRIGSIVRTLIHNCQINILEVSEMLGTLITKKESIPLTSSNLVKK